MKKLKAVYNEVRSLYEPGSGPFDPILWKLICYPPKIAVRLQQQQLLDLAVPFTLTVRDDFFSNTDLAFHGFVWGSGSRTIRLTHGWGSKAADYADLIQRLLMLNDTRIIAFDAPGNGSSEGELSNLLLFVLAVEAVTARFGEPDVFIGHSLGAMANSIAISERGRRPGIQVSIAPLIRLKENFEDTMTAAGVPADVQQAFFEEFEAKFHVPATYFNLEKLYSGDSGMNHFLFYDEFDQTAKHVYLERFLTGNPSITARAFNNTGHNTIIRNAEVIEAIYQLVISNNS